MSFMDKKIGDENIRDMVPLRMDWTDELNEEMRGRLLSLIEVLWVVYTLGGGGVAVVLCLGAAFILLATDDPVAVTFFLRILLPFAIFSAYYVVVYIWLKKAARVSPISWFILCVESVVVVGIIYLCGAPLYFPVMLYPLLIALYSIWLHPVLATRFFLTSTFLLGGITWLIGQGMIPDGITLVLGGFAWLEGQEMIIPNGPPLGGQLESSYIIVVMISLMVLAVTNSLVTRLRRREEDLVASSERITRLSDKLKVYLPHQFVESLASGERDTEPDYRRRRLTVFFSDVQGFTSWTDKLEPEEVREILDKYLSEMGDIIHKWGGTIDKFIGDAIMVFFGDPEFTDDKDHATRCVKMALEMQEKMVSLREEWQGVGYQMPLHIRIGINTGYATVGNFGSKERLDYTALGSAVNLASRLETACNPDKINVSHMIYSLIKDEIECEAKGTIEAKGFTEPVKIYEVKGLTG